MQKNQILKILRAPSIRHQGVLCISSATFGHFQVFCGGRVNVPIIALQRSRLVVIFGITERW